MKHKVFALKNLTVKNAYTTFLEAFNMHVYQGQILGIICTDFNEKNALLNIFEGEYQVPEKNVYFDSTEKKKTPSHIMFRKYFSVIGTEQKVLPDLSVIDNILLTPEQPAFLMNHSASKTKAKSLLQEFRLDIPLNSPVNTLTAAQRYCIELLRAFVQKKRIVVLANMNDRFNSADTDMIFSVIEKLHDRNMTFFMMIDTPDKTLTDFTDELLIIKNGRDIAQIETGIFHFSELYNYMLTGSINTPAIHTLAGFYDDSADYDEDDDDPVAEFSHVSTLSFENLDFCLYSGELIKIISADQKSIYAIRRLLNGTESVVQGTINLKGDMMRPGDQPATIKKGIYWCPQGPYLNLLFDGMSMIDNLMLGPMTKADMRHISDGLRENLQAYCEKYFPGIDYNKPVKMLNNNIRQELAYRKILLQAPKLVFIEKPFEETILGMNDITIRMIGELQRRGTCIVILSMSMSDAEILDGDTLYMKECRMIDEMEMYAQRY